MSNDKPKILIVDDEIDICLLLYEILKYDYDVEYQQTITDAKVALENYSPNLMLLDLDLTDGSGFDLLAYIKTNKEVKDLHEPDVIIVSAHKGKFDVQKADEYGVHSFMEKPIELEALKQAVAELV
jgi:DNA-binding NtrC family response regulator